MNSDGTGATFRERSTWAQLITTALIYGGVLIGTFQDPTNASRTAGFLAGAVVLQVLALTVLHPMLAGQFLLFCFVGSEVVRLATQAVSYRRGV